MNCRLFYYRHVVHHLDRAIFNAVDIYTQRLTRHFLRISAHSWSRTSINIGNIMHWMQPPLSRKEERRECTMDSARIPEKIDEVPFKAIVRKLLQAHCDSKLMRSWTRIHTRTDTYTPHNDERNNEKDDWPTCRKKCNGEGWRAGSSRALSFCIVRAKYEESRSSRFCSYESARCLIVNEGLYGRRRITICR